MLSAFFIFSSILYYKTHKKIIDRRQNQRMLETTFITR